MRFYKNFHYERTKKLRKSLLFYNFFKFFQNLQEQGVTQNSHLRLKAWLLAGLQKNNRETFGHPTNYKDNETNGTLIV